MIRKTMSAALLAALFAFSPPLAPAPLAAQQPLSRPLPRWEAARRRAILDALRPSVEAQIGPNVEFVVRDFRVIGDWAFVLADPQRRGGGRIDGHLYFPQFDQMGGLTVTALLRFRHGRWHVIEKDIGATDVWYCGRGPRGLTPSCTPD